ncbi:MAG: SDR family NAD(P)-dependent oxidoreductase, partial [Deltaproteobacteria bacterium]|nr:SDR family NAD(P)-dependent oxidoreductase [Deltaproteobacteria bacterium]
DAAARIRAAHPRARVEALPLDLASLASVGDAASRLLGSEARLDVLVNNAGVMALPRRLTADGFEMQFGTNHLGHFALTGRLLPLLLATPRSRVVNVSSLAHAWFPPRFDDAMGARLYFRWHAYSQSKLSNLLYTFALDRRLRRGGHALAAVAAHPGWAATNLQAEGFRMEGSAIGAGAMELANRLVAQDALAGALPTLYAAAAPQVDGGQFIGPDGFRQMRGAPRVVGCHRRARDVALQERLWALSVELTGVEHGALGAA